MKPPAETSTWNYCIPILWLICALAMSPVLVHPHWGMFSDPNQIVEACTTIYAHGFDWNLWQQNMWVDFRPGFHLLDLLMWGLSSDKPLGFYLFRFICFALTVTFTYLNCYQLSRARAISFVTSLTWFLAYPTYEVIYTLDKGEIYLGLLFALFVYGYLTCVELVRTGIASKLRFSWCLSLMVFSAAYAIFTKQTGLLVVGYSAVLLVVSLICIVLESQKSSTSEAALDACKSCKRKALLAPVLALTISLVSWGIFRAFYVAHGGLQFKYGEVVTNPSFLASQLVVYMQAIPEFFTLLAFATIVTTFAMFHANKGNDDNRPAAMQSLCLLLTVIAGSFAMCAWKSQVGYIWYPIFSILLPSVSFSIFITFGASIKKVVLFFAVAAAMLLPERVYDAQTQFAMDVIFNQFIEQLSRLPKELGHTTNAIVKLREQNSAELGEELECALRDVNRGKTRTGDLQPFPLKIYNIIRNTAGDLGTDRKTLTEEVAYPKSYELGAGLDKFMYLPDQLPHWTVAKVKTGDLLLIPYGNVPVKTAPYRGILCFAKPENALSESLPQCHLKLLLKLSRGYKRLNGDRTEIGWSVYQIEAAPPLALPLGDYGWYRNDQNIYLEPRLNGKTLTFESGESLAQDLYIGSGEASVKIGKSKLSNGAEGYVFRLPQNPVHVSGGEAFHQPVLFKVKSVAITDHGEALKTCGN